MLAQMLGASPHSPKGKLQKQKSNFLGLHFKHNLQLRKSSQLQITNEATAMQVPSGN